VDSEKKLVQFALVDSEKKLVQFALVDSEKKFENVTDTNNHNLNNNENRQQ
jgi:hypothetical protein